MKKSKLLANVATVRSTFGANNVNSGLDFALPREFR